MGCICFDIKHFPKSELCWKYFWENYLFYDINYIFEKYFMDKVWQQTWSTTFTKKKLIWLHILKTWLLDCIIFMFLTHMLNFVSIGSYLLFDALTYFLYIILYYKNLKFKYLIDNIAIDLWYFRNYASIEDII